MNGKTTPVYGIIGVISTANSIDSDNLSLFFSAAIRPSRSNPVPQ